MLFELKVEEVCKIKGSGSNNREGET